MRILLDHEWFEAMSMRADRHKHAGSSRAHNENVSLDIKEVADSRMRSCKE